MPAVLTGMITLGAYALNTPKDNNDIPEGCTISDDTTQEHIDTKHDGDITAHLVCDSDGNYIIKIPNSAVDLPLADPANSAPANKDSLPPNLGL